MSETSSLPPQQEGLPRDAANWAARGTQLRVSEVPVGAINLNVDGRNVVSPLQGFGKMWQKTYRVSLAGAAVTPREVIAVWKANFQSFWPKGNRFYIPLTGVMPGEVALLNLRTGGMPLSTGVLVLYADDEAFTLMTPEGHLFAGWITFSAFERDGVTIAQAQVLMRANDPFYETVLRFGGHRQEDKFWRHTLTALAAYFHLKASIETERVCVDRRRQWRYARNIWHNASLRTIFTIPARWFGGGGRQRRHKETTKSL